MKNLMTAAEQLRNMADQLEAMQTAFMLPVQEIDIPRAFTTLRAALGPEVHLAIYPPSIDSYSSDHQLKVNEWAVYLGVEIGKAHGRYEGATLTNAVNAALAACQPEKEGDPVAEINAITEAFAKPLPL